MSNAITFIHKDGRKIVFREGDIFVLNEVEFRIVTIKDKGKMVIKPTPKP